MLYLPARTPRSLYRFLWRAPQGVLSSHHRSRNRTPFRVGLSTPTPRCAAGYPLQSLTRRKGMPLRYQHRKLAPIQTRSHTLHPHIAPAHCTRTDFRSRTSHRFSHCSTLFLPPSFSPDCTGKRLSATKRGAKRKHCARRPWRGKRDRR